MEVNIYIESSILRMKCTQYGLHEQATFKNAKTILFFEIGQNGQQFFGRDLNIINYFVEAALESSCGGNLASATLQVRTCGVGEASSTASFRNSFYISQSIELSRSL